MEIESILSKLGRLGKFQILMYIFCGLQGISFPVWDMLSVTSFMAPAPDYACRIEIIDEDNKPQVKYAALNSSSMSTGACEEGELVFNLDTYGRTMVTEWQLVGEKAMFVELSQSLFMVGMMLGSVVLGQMSDMFGRRPILIISATLSPLMSVASGFVPNIFVFTGLRIMIGFICPGAILTSYVLALELFPACRRAAASILLSSFNGIGYVGLAVLAYYIKDWRNLQIATGAIRCGLIPLCLFVPESIQWLAAKGKHQKLEKLLQRIAKINKIDIAFPILETKTDIPAATKPPDTEEELYTPIINEETTEKGKSMEDLFMYDSALSLDRDYIPDEDQYSTNTYSSESETEEPVPPLTSSSRTRFPSALFQQDRIFPGHCQQVFTDNLCHVNSSISILSELQKGCEQYESYETLTKPEPGPSIAVSAMPVGKPSQKKPQRKKSVSMCHLPNIVAFISETETSDSPSSSSESGETAKFAGLLRTTSIPNITKNPSVEALDRQIHVDSVAQRSSALTRVHKRPPALTIPQNEGMGSSFLLSVPTLALPFGYSQNMFPNVGVQYENIESSQSESEESLRDDSDTSGFNSSTTNMDRLTDYEALEAGYSFNTTPQQKGYSEIKTSSDEPLKPKKIRKGYNALDLFRKSSVRLVTIVSMIMWFATYSVYVGLSMSTDELAGDPYINFSLVGLVEIPAVIVAAFSAVRIGRRYPSGVFHFLAALSCCVFLMIPSDSASSWTPLVSVVAILSAKCFTSAAYNVECLLTAEVLPTPLRTVGIGMFVLCSRIGGVIVPFILLTGESWNKYPMMIFAALSVVSSLMLLPLPEMIGMPQPQTPDDIKKIRKISKERRNSKAKLPISFV